MATKKTSGPKQPLDPKVADTLLNLLSHDDDFRREFKNDPGAALATLGHDMPATDGMACAAVQSIAPKQEFAAARDQLKAELISAGVFTNPHCFEAGKVASSLSSK